MDRISDLPLCITETILGLLPYQDVVRTSALSKEWRYRWTKIPNIMVIADWQTLDRCKLLCGVGQALLMHEGPIHEFTLSVVKYECGMYWEIDRVISHLSSNNTLKKLTIDFGNGASSGYKSLPSSLFSMTQLTVLYLNGCDLIHEPTFSWLKRPGKHHTSWLSKREEKLTVSGLGSLTSLYVQNSQISIKTLLNLLSKSPLLKTVELKSYEFYDSGDATITNLFESFMVIESLTISRGIIEFSALNGNQGRIHERAPIALLHLNYLCVEYIFFEWYFGLQIIALFVRSSPNLEKLKLMIADDGRENEMSCPRSLEDYADIWLEHLRELEITYLSDLKSELDVVKLILMRSPVLKKLRIFISKIYKDKELQISETLLSSPRASPVVEFIFEIEPF